MSRNARVGSALALVVAAIAMPSAASFAQNRAPNPYLTLDNRARLPDGRTWGSTSAAQGNIWVGGRCGSNSCAGNTDLVSILQFDLATGAQFSRPSGLFIDNNDILYSADSESNATWAGHTGWKRGIRIGSAMNGSVTAFIPDPTVDQDRAGTPAAEGVAADGEGTIYGAEVGPRALKEYVKR